MLLHELSCPIGGLLLSILMLKDANPNHYPVAGVECVVSHESRQFTDDGHKVLLGHLGHPLRVGNILVSAHCNVHSFSPPPKRRRGRRVPPNQLINVPSVKGYKGWRNFGESPKGEVRRIPIPRTRVNKGMRKGRGCSKPRPFLCVKLPTFLDRALLDLSYLVGHQSVRRAVYGLSSFLVRGVCQAEDLARLFVEPILEVLNPVL